MGMNKKSQACMEFIMTYGWAILVLMVAVGALAYFGVFNKCSFMPKDSIYYNENCISEREKADKKATELCENLYKEGERYPEYQEKINGMKEVMTIGVIYLPESPNIPDNNPRIMQTGIEGNELKWMGNISNIKSVFCIIPSEICFLTAGITTCVLEQHRMQFDYDRWRNWFYENKKH